MHSKSVKLPSSMGTTMTGTIDFPDGEPVAYAIFAHCFTCSRFAPAASRVCKTLSEHGIAALRFDFPGLGQSEGNFADTSFSSNVADIIAASDWLTENYSAPQLLVGHSLGGAAALQAATKPEMKHLAAVATLGAPFDPAHSVLHFADRVKDADEDGSVTVVLGGRDIVISKEFLEDLADTNPEAYLPDLRKPLMLIHSPIDTTVGVDNAQKIFRKTRYPKSLVSIDKADHLFTRGTTAQRAGHMIAEWAHPYFTPDHLPVAVGPEEVRSSTAAGTRFGDVVRTEKREIVTDRAKGDGGKGQGFSAVDLVMSALAAATSQAVRAAAKGMPLDDVEVSIIHASGATFQRKISLSGQLSQQQRQTLLKAATSSSIQGMLSGANIMDVPA
ncbi:bifunctional alpha/beta hydrolase/OsmC family protein [Corynebacterium alimapuense]|nr:alpha/beta fold hydrolase [Corynebacterium alimapuense]